MSSLIPKMARNLGLPYRAGNPRSVRGAVRRGWHRSSPRPGYTQDISWLKLNIWCDNNLTGYWVSNYLYREFAFESAADATMFQLKWG